MTIISRADPYLFGYNFTYIVPISIQGENVSVIFGDNWGKTDIFTEISPTEFQFSGNFVYSPSGYKAFRFYSDIFPTQGEVTLHTTNGDFKVDATVPQAPCIPESPILFLIPCILALFLRKR